MDWIEVRRDGHLLFRFCPAKRLIEIRRNGDTHVVDLDELRRCEARVSGDHGPQPAQAACPW